MDYRDLFDNYGVKSVSPNDLSKEAYVPDAGQNAALRAAGYIPSNGGGAGSTLVSLKVLSDEGASIIGASYYLALRKEEGRTPEARMGRDIIRWMAVGDRVLIGNIGSDIFVGKIGHLSLTEIAYAVAEDGAEADLRAKALRSKRRPTRTVRTVTEFRRNLYVVAAALKRADGRCEVPGCTHSLFQRDTGPYYLEVHHIVPLGEGGEDTLLNVAAICPACHREYHFGTDRSVRRDALLDHVKKLEAGIEASLGS